ncbi:MAG: toll/interleukin-1 receptor domain-containing protein [Sphingomonas sp.]
MQQTVFMSFAPADASKAAGIASLLRRHGIAVTGDLTLPAGTVRADVMGPALAEALIVLPLWSAATAAAPFVAEEADAAAARGAYLGVRLDRTAPPPRFAGRPEIDLAAWSGGEDRPMRALIDAIVARLPERPVPPRAADADTREASRTAARRRMIVLAGLAVVLIAAAAILIPILTRKPPTAQDALRATIAAIPCSWLQVDPIDDGSRGRLVLTGVADRPEAAGAQVRALLAKDGAPATVTVTTDRIARIASADCPAIDVPRALRRDDGGRMRVTSDGVGRDAAMRLAEARVHFSFRPQDRAIALFGIEPSGKVTSILPDFAALDALAKEDVGFAKQGRDYDFSLRSDHLGWTGLLLVTGGAPLPNVPPQGAVLDSGAFADYLRAAARTGDQQAEMVWYEIMPR